MAKKTYRTHSLTGLDIHYTDKKGNRHDIVFRGGIQIDSTAKYSTSDAEEQEYLEKCSGFGRDYYIEKVQEDAFEEAEKVFASSPEPEKPLTDVKDVRRFRNLVEMKAAMKELGFDVKDNWNYLSARTAAQKEGYDFQIAR